MSMSHRIHAAKVVAKRELFSTLYGLGLYVVLFLVFILSSYTVHSAIFGLEQNGLAALPTPMTSPFFLAVTMIAIYLGMCSAIAISRERDQGTLEVLFYGPVDSISYIGGKYGQQMLTFGVTLVFCTINFFLVSLVTNFGFSGHFIGMFFLSIFLASCMVSFGIFLSTITKRTNISVIVYIALMVALLYFPFARNQVLSIPGKDLSTVMVYVRIVLDNLNVLMQWISPVAYFERGLLAVGLSSFGQYAISIAASTIYTAVLLALSVKMFERKGAKR